MIVSTKLNLSSFCPASSCISVFSSSGTSFTARQLIVFTTRPITAQIKATTLHPFAPPPKCATAPVTANPITILVTTANIKRIDPNCTRSVEFFVINADNVEYAIPFAV